MEASERGTFLRNTWYMAMWGEALTAGMLEARQILGEPIVFFRKQDGSIAAMLDACPHRFAAFSALGRLQPNDRIQCAYHGLTFDTAGRCVHNPHSDTLPAAARVKVYPCAEQDSIVWIWMGDPARADVAAIPRFPTLVESPPELVAKRDYLEFDASYLLLIENLLDLSHANILHEGILGNAEAFDAEIKVEADDTSVVVTRLNTSIPVPSMFDLMYKRSGGRVDMWGTVTWQAPGSLVNDTGVTEVGGTRETGTGVYGHHFLTPMTETKTLYHFCAVRQNAPRLDAETESFVRDQLTDLRRTAFVDQDKVVISAQQQRLLNPAVDTSRPALLNIDVASVRFRRVLDGLLAKERQAQAE